MLPGNIWTKLKRCLSRKLLQCHPLRQLNVFPTPCIRHRGRRGATDVSFYISALSRPPFLISNFLLLLLCLPPPPAASYLSPPSLFPTLRLSISHLPLSLPPLASFPLTTLGKCRHVFTHFKIARVKMKAICFASHVSAPARLNLQDCNSVYFICSVTLSALVLQRGCRL